MASILDYSTTAASNTSVGGVNVAEGMRAGLVNNAMRAMMADTRKWQLDWSGIVTGGTGNAYTITTNQGIAAYADGMRFTFRADRANTGAATLNVDGRGAKSIRKVTGVGEQLAANDIVNKAVYDVVYDLASDIMVIVGFGLPTVTTFAKTLLDDANAATMRTTLGAQAADADLTSIAALSGTGIAVRTAADAWATRTITSADGSVTITNPGGVAGDINLSAVPSRKLLATKTASSSATLDFTEFNNATYRRYEFELDNVKPATDGVDFYLRTSTNAGSSYESGASDYAWGLAGTSANSATSGSSSGDVAILMTTVVKAGNAANEYGYSGDLILMGAPSAIYCTVRYSLTYWNTAGALVQVDGGGARLAAQDTDAVRFLFSSGNIASGTIRMYGIV